MTDYINQHAVSLNHNGFLGATETLAELIAQSRDERPLQSFLEQHPYVLSQQLSHCHHVFPLVKFGASYVADFFCLDIPSSGYEWVAIEIESPGKKVVTKSGRKSADLEHALQQVRDWRKWISDNIDYARRPRENNGLGLAEIQPRFMAWVIIGRRANYNEAFNSLRQQVFRDELIQIRSWDGILERAVQRAHIFSGGGPGIEIKLI
jgi:Domain of unknown function (DUF4263)